MILYAKIRRMYFRDKLSINEIVRRRKCCLMRIVVPFEYLAVCRCAAYMTI